jgi:ADP-Ribosyltransferase in polyvalent proteins
VTSIAAKAKASGGAERDAHDAEQQKKEVVAVGMNSLRVSPGALEGVLKDNFAHVVQFWDSRNFKGYISSDSRQAIDKLLGNMLSTDSEYATTATPRNITKSTTRQTDSDAFKSWFGASKVVDEQGNPLVVYHGTTADFDAFDPAAIGKNFPYVAGVLLLSHPQRGDFICA